MENVNYFDLVPGKKHETAAPIRVTGWTVMTNGNVRVWFELIHPEVVRAEQQGMRRFLDLENVTSEPPTPVAAEGNAALASKEPSEDFVARQRKVERDYAVGPGSKKHK